jgi:hypothetical protein
MSFFEDKKNQFFSWICPNIIVYYCSDADIDAFWYYKHILSHFSFGAVKGQIYPYNIYINIHNWITLLILSFKVSKYAQMIQNPSKYIYVNYRTFKRSLKISSILGQNLGNHIYVNIRNLITLLILSFRTWKYAQMIQNTWKYFTTNFHFWCFFYKTPCKLRAKTFSKTFSQNVLGSQWMIFFSKNTKCTRLRISRVLNRVELIILSNLFSLKKYTL